MSCEADHCYRNYECKRAWDPTDDCLYLVEDGKPAIPSGNESYSQASRSCEARIAEYFGGD